MYMVRVALFHGLGAVTVQAAGNPNWWRIREAALLAVGSMGENLKEAAEEGQASRQLFFRLLPFDGFYSFINCPVSACHCLPISYSSSSYFPTLCFSLTLSPFFSASLRFHLFLSTKMIAFVPSTAHSTDSASLPLPRSSHPYLPEPAAWVESSATV
jgi:hypothetical protein